MERRGLLIGRQLTPHQWAFAAFHTARDIEDERDEQRQRDRLLSTVLLVAVHDPEKAKGVIDKAFAAPEQGDTEDEPGEEEFMALDPLFADRTPLSEIEAREQRRGAPRAGQDAAPPGGTA